MTPDVPDDPAGSGTNLPPHILATATFLAGVATLLSLWTIVLQLKNYRKITLQRFVVRILIMVPIYGLSSLISLYSLDLAFFVDAIRDVYEAFVIYCFFTLLVEYLGGERSLIILLHGRAPIAHLWPVSIFFPPMDVSDPFTFLGLKRGILQYVQVKPILAAITVILKATGTYRDGALERNSGYTYVSIVHNVSVTLSLYCLAMFWVATHDDLLPFRPMPKFLCVKGLIFASFWQGFVVSILVAMGVLKSDRYSTETLSLAIQDTLMCYEMPLFAFMHLYAFSYTDYIDENHQYSGRLPFFYALRDAFGFKDVFSDSVTTVKGTGFSYRTFEPAEGGLHQGLGRDRRVRAGLRYADGGKKKYWLETPGEESDAYGRKGRAGLIARPFHTVKKALETRLDQREGYAPLPEEEASEVVHADEEGRGARTVEEYERWLREGVGREYDDVESDSESLGFEDPEEDEVENLYDDARRLEFGDFAYPVVDASKEAARRRMREEEEGIVHRRPPRTDKGKGRASPRSSQPHRSSYGHFADPNPPAPPPHHDAANDPPTRADHPAPEGHRVVEGARSVYHAIKGDDVEEQLARRRGGGTHGPTTGLPPDAFDLVVEDKQAAEEEMARERRRGEPGAKRKRVYRQTYTPPEGGGGGFNSPVVAEDGSVKKEATITEGHVVEVKEDGGEVAGEEGVKLVVKEVELKSREVEPPASGVEEGGDANPWG